MELVFLGVLIALMVIALTAGFPVAFALPGSAVLSIGLAALCGWLFAGDPSAYFAQDGPTQWLSAGVTNFRSLYWDVERDTLIAIPLFIFMGIMLQKSRIAEDLLVAMAQLFGPVPGGMGISVVFVGALLAATTGIVGATVIAMGLISLPAMLRNNYSKPLATGTICAAGTLGQIIPPSIVLIILADQLSNAADQAAAIRQQHYRDATGEFSMPSSFDVVSASAGDMFMGALIPGLILVAIYMGYILISALLRPADAPPVPYEGGYDRAFFARVVIALVPPLLLIFAVLGSIVLGIATVNQAGAIGAAGATIMAGYRLHRGRPLAYAPGFLGAVCLILLLILINSFDLNIKNIETAADRTGIMIGMLASAGLLASVGWSLWRIYRSERTLHEVMGETAKITSMVFIILIGAAMLTSAFRGFGGEELVKHFLLGLPGGFWTQFIVVMAVIFLLGFFLDFIEIAVVVVPIVAPILLADPSANITAVWLGVMIGLNIQTSFLTPPFGFALFYLRGVAPPQVRTTHIYKGASVFIALQLLGLAIAGVAPPLVNYLPNRTYLSSETAPPPINPRLQECLETQLFVEYAQDAHGLRDAVAAARAFELRHLPGEWQTKLTRHFDAVGATFNLAAEAERAATERAAYGETYAPLHAVAYRQSLREPDLPPPAGYPEARARYRELAKAENAARLRYRQHVDAAYGDLAELRTALTETPQIEVMQNALAQFDLRGEPTETEETLKAMSAESARWIGGGDIRGALSNTRRALRSDTPDYAAARSALAEAQTLLQQQLAWRQTAAPLVDDLAAYDAVLKNNIGLRQQTRLPENRVKPLAGCLAEHRDISLNF